MRTIQLVDARDGSPRPASDVSFMRPKPLARRLSAKRRANKTRIRSVLSLGSPGLRSPWRMELLSRNSVKILVSPPWAIRAPRRLHRLSLVSHVRIARRTWVLAVLPRASAQGISRQWVGDECRQIWRPVRDLLDDYLHDLLTPPAGRPRRGALRRLCRLPAVTLTASSGQRCVSKATR